MSLVAGEPGESRGGTWRQWESGLAFTQHATVLEGKKQRDLLCGSFESLWAQAEGIRSRGCKPLMTLSLIRRAGAAISCSGCPLPLCQDTDENVNWRGAPGNLQVPPRTCSGWDSAGVDSLPANSPP